MSIIKKIGKFIAARALYLALGVFLAAGLMAFAAWDDARTGGSGELSENNWNELVNMIESEIGGGGGLTDCQLYTKDAGIISGKATVFCDDERVLITGGCSITEGFSVFVGWDHPVNNGWRCSFSVDGAPSVSLGTACAWCCK